MSGKRIAVELAPRECPQVERWKVERRLLGCLSNILSTCWGKFSTEERERTGERERKRGDSINLAFYAALT